MYNELQAAVDALADELGRPIGVDDQRFRAVAYSSHLEAIDPVRLASILQREAPREVIEWLESEGVRDAEDYVRIAHNDRFGMAARVCVPIRFDGTLLGYLWLIDAPPLTDAQLRTSLRSAEELAVALFRMRRIEHEDRDRERELLEQLVAWRPGDPREAAGELLHHEFLATAPRYAVLALQAVHADGREPPDEVRVRIAAAAERVRRGVMPRHMLVLVTGEQVLSVLAFDADAEPDRRGGGLIEHARENLADSPGWTVLVGIGGERSGAGELHRSYVEAQHALRLGRSAAALGPVVRWDALGSYRPLAMLAGARDTSVVLPTSLRRLLACSEADVLVATLERYLDEAGDARAAAEALYVHRSSLYARLHRIEQIAGVDLHSGDDRLELHIGLRLWRMGGMRTN